MYIMIMIMAYHYTAGRKELQLSLAMEDMYLIETWNIHVIITYV